MRQTLLPLLGVFLRALLLPASASAETTLCLRASTDEEVAGLRQLVESEVGRHRSHRVVHEGCASTLLIELFRVSGVRYLTARVDGEVPVRFVVKTPRELPERLGEALRLVLGSDPAHLAEDITRYSAVQRAALSLVRRGHNRFRIELLETITRTAGGAAFAPGGALSFGRSADHFAVYARLYAAGSATAAGEGTQPLRYLIGGEIGLLFETSRRAATTFYLGPLLSLHGSLLRGQIPSRSEIDSANRIDLSLGLRLGLRFLRTHSFDADLFAAGYFPMSNAKDVDSLLPQVYAPTLSLGTGIGF